MKFSKNKLYIESYTKCANCGILIFEGSERSVAPLRAENGKIYCSSWCVDWEAEREARRAAEATPR